MRKLLIGLSTALLLLGLSGCFGAVTDSDKEESSSSALSGQSNSLDKDKAERLADSLHKNLDGIDGESSDDVADALISSWHAVGYSRDGDLEYDKTIDGEREINASFHADGSAVLQIDGDTYTGEWELVAVDDGIAYYMADYVGDPTTWIFFLGVSDEFDGDALIMTDADDLDWQLGLVREGVQIDSEEFDA